MKVAMVKPGRPFEIVTNIHSKRKTETIVAWDGEERLYGADAANIGVRRPASAYTQIRTLLGSSVDHPNVQELTEVQYYPYTFSANETRGNLQVVHEQKGKDENGQKFHAEELVAMVFTHARDITKGFSGGYIDDWVITVPAYFSISQRQAMLDAAELARIRVLSLMNENTAAALQFGIDRIYDEPTRVLFYNMGSTSLQVSVVEYSNMVVPDGFKKNKTVGAFTVLGHAWNTQVGGSAFDLRLAEYLADEVNEQFGLTNVDIRHVPRPFAKLRAQAKKTKIVLSANEQIPVVIQSLYQDQDFKTSVSRAKFEELTGDLFDKCLEPVKSLLKDLELVPSDLSLVEIIGGGVRMPRIKSMLREYVGQDLSVHLNGDEAMALGAAFHAANLSTSFRVRTIGMNDIQTYGVSLRLMDRSSDWVKKASLFKRNSNLGAKKIVSFAHDHDFEAVFSYDDASVALLPAGTRRVISHYQIQDLTAFTEEMAERKLGPPKVTLTFALSPSGLVSISQAEAVVEEPLEPQEEPEKENTEADETKKNEPEETEKKEAEETEKNEPESKASGDTTPDKDDNHETTSGTTADNDSEKTDNEKDAENHSDKSEKPKAKKTIKTKPKPKQHRRVLTVTRKPHAQGEDTSILPMSVLEKQESMVMLREMQQRDDARRETASAKNELEAFVFSARDSIDSRKTEVLEAKVMTEADLEALEAEVNDTEDWLYDEGEDASKEEFQNRLTRMKTKLEKMVHRLTEMSARPAAVKRVTSYAKTVKELVEEWPTSKPYLTQDDINDVSNRTETLVSWTQARMDEQAKVAPHEDPVFASSEILRKLKTLKRFVNSINDRKPPKPAAPVKNETLVENQNTTSTDPPTAEEPSAAEKTKSTDPSKEEL